MSATTMHEKKSPSLRFPNMTAPWHCVPFSDVCKVNQGLQIPIAERSATKVPGGFFYITNEFLRENPTVSYYIRNPSSSVVCTEDDVLMTRTGNTGKVVTGVAGVFHNNFFRIKYDQALCTREFLVYTLRHPAIQYQILRLAGTSTIPDLNHGDFYSITIALPSVWEQQKIANFLGSVDAWLDNLRKQKTALETYKRGMMQKLFRQEVWFKDEDGKEYPEWTHVRFGDVFKRVATKNKGEHCKRVLTISGAQGLVAQLEYYNHSYASKDLSGYTHIKRDEFAYNKSYSSGYPMGAIKRLVRHDEGVVSPLYICFRKQPTRKDVLAFLEYYFESGLFNRQIVKIAQEGARSHGLLNLSVSDLFDDTLLLLPNAAEQHKIADFLTSLDQTITAKADEIAKVEQWKKGLTQKMFV